MEAEYKRDLSHNYLILPKICDNYQLKMFITNPIPGLLEGSVRIIEGEEKIYYRISSRQKLTRVFEKKEMDFSDLKRLFFSLQSAMQETERYLLNAEYIVFDPEMVYYDLSREREEWIFYPTGQTDEGQETLTKLAEYVLDKVDHSDVLAVDLAYHFYRSVKEHTFLIGDVIKRMEELNVRTEEHLNEENGELREEELKVVREEDELRVMKEEEDLLGRFLRFLRKVFAGKKEKAAEKAPKEPVEGGEALQWKDPPALYGGEKDEYEKTRLLFTSESSGRGELIRTDSGERYSLERLPAIAGKMREKADIYISHPSVSRMHARFYEEKGNVFIEDLNSTNGCSVNDIPLESNEQVLLSKGDRISLGEVNFIYN